MKTLREVYDRIHAERIELTTGTLQQYRIAVGWFEKVHGRVAVRDLTPLHIVGVMRHLRDNGRSERTVNNARKNLLTIWRYGEDFGAAVPPVPAGRRIPRMREPAPLPRAWNADQMARLTEACLRAPMQRGWTGQHWLALVLTVYDTSLRIGCLMRSTLDQLDSDTCSLTIPGRLQKGRRETCQPLHPDTFALLVSLQRTDNRLFPWPYRREELWRKFRAILSDAGLPHGRRDQFHKIRRTSYTMVAVQFGIATASEHAAHTRDMSANYLDKRFLQRESPLTALPRPSSRTA